MGKRGLKGCLYVGIKNAVWLIAGLPVPNGNRHASEISKMALRYVLHLVVLNFSRANPRLDS
jgi:hypothetical protein